MNDCTTGYWVDAPGHGSLREVALAQPGEGEVYLHAICTGISVLVERLLGLGRAPQACTENMACAGMQGSFTLPILYGGSFVGRVDGGPDAGRRAFVRRPHQRHAVANRTELVWLPNGVPDARATLFSGLETACNAVWDADLEGNERIAVVGSDAIGLLIAFVLAHRHDGQVVIVERDEAQRQAALALPWVHSAVTPVDVLEGGTFSHAMHTSATAEGLQFAIDAVGFEGQVIDSSWYGDAAVSVQLGTSFHHQRKRIAASHAGTIARSHRDAGAVARDEEVLTLLADANLDALLGEAVPFAELPTTFAAIYSGQLATPCPVVSYS